MNDTKQYVFKQEWRIYCFCLEFYAISRCVILQERKSAWEMFQRQKINAFCRFWNWQILSSTLILKEIRIFCRTVIFNPQNQKSWTDKRGFYQIKEDLNVRGYS